MHKRIISLVLILALLPACLAVPAMADERDTVWFDLLDYGYPLYRDSNIITLDGSTATIILDNPSGGPLYYVDILLRTNSFSFRIATYSENLTISSLGNGLYRAYGVLKNIPDSTARIWFADYNGSYVELLSFKVCSHNVDSFTTSVSATINAMGYPNQIFNISYPDSPYGNWKYDSYEHYEGASTFGVFKSDFRFTDWKKYDYVELQLGLFVAEVNSVSAYIGEQIVSLDVSHIENADQVGNYYLHIRADLSGFNRDTSDVLTIVVNGCGHFQLTNQVNIYDACGLVIVPEPSLWNHWFTNLQGWLSSGFSSVTLTLSTLGTNIGNFIGNQTSSLISAIVSHQQALIDAEKTQHEADRQLWNTISSNVGTWISNQTTAITTFRANVGTWFTSQTNSIVSTISSWGKSIVDSIDALPDKIAQALKDLVVPQDGAIESMATKSETLVSNRFGGVFEGAQIVDNWAGQLQAQAATQILTIPIVNMNILGTNFPIGGWEVDLVPDGFEIIFESVKLIIDILATAAFINGIKLRLERTLEK